MISTALAAREEQVMLIISSFAAEEDEDHDGILSTDEVTRSSYISLPPAAVSCYCVTCCLRCLLTLLLP